MGRLKIYFDGGCRPNPGVMETAVVARGITYFQRDCGYGSSNEAEWLALIEATTLALSIGEHNVALLGDSALVVLQANGVNKCRDSILRAQLSIFMELKSGFTKVTVARIARSQNLAGIALTKLRWQPNQGP